MKKKRSVVLLIAVTFFISYSLFSVTQYFDDSNKKYDYELKRKINSMQLYFLLAKSFIEEGLIKELEDRLEQARYYKEIQFYILQHDGLVIYYGNKDDRLDNINKNYSVYNQVLFYPKYFYSTLKVDDYVLTIGHYKHRSKTLYHVAERDFRLIIKDMFLVGLLILAISFYYLKDFQKILFSFSQRKGRDFSKIKSNSYELDMFLKGLTGYEKNIKNLKEKAASLSDQVLPALQSELMSGQKPPYDFDCTMVLTDINNYSHIYDNYDKSEFITLIKEFFFEAAHIISKHGGLVYKFVGDEALYYFKDAHHRNSAAVAISAVSELNALTESLNEQYCEHLGYKLAVKSALAHGKVTLDSMIDTYELFGTNIIEGSRILSAINLKDENSIFYGETVKSKIDFLCSEKAEFVADLKGIKGKRQLYSYVAHDSLLDNLQMLTQSNIDRLYYYRKDTDIVEILNYLRDHADDLDENLYITTTNLMKHFTVTKTSDSVRNAFTHLLGSLAKEYKQTGEERCLFYISSIIMISINLISKSAFDEELATILKSFLNYEDKRVVANTLDAFVHFDASNEDLLFETLLKHQNNRILANALIKDGMIELSDEVIDEIENMLASENAYFVASGIFAVGELTRYHKEQDIVYFNTNIRFYSLIAKMKTFLKHENDMIRRQVYMAARKINDEKLNSRVNALLKSKANPLISSEITEFFLEESVDSEKNVA